MVPLPGNEMVLTNRELADQLAIIAARLEGILALLRGDVTVIADGSYCEKEDGCNSGEPAEDGCKSEESDEDGCNNEEVDNDLKNTVEKDAENESQICSSKPSRSLAWSPSPKPISENVAQYVTHNHTPQCLFFHKLSLVNIFEKMPSSSCGPYCIILISHVSWLKSARVQVPAIPLAFPPTTTAWEFDFQPRSIIEWLIAWHRNSLLSDLRTSRLSGRDVLI